jgi:anti-sigma factor RsiW
MRLLIQADVDGELAAAEAARVGVHLEGCRRCAELRAGLLALSGRLRREVTHYPASDALHAATRRLMAAGAVPELQEKARSSTAKPGPWQRIVCRASGFGPVAPFGAGFALAACLALALVMPRDDALPDAVVAGHIRALQPGHLMDIASTDQHNVKPWFDGRLDFAPPVKDFASGGFALVGGRLDYLAGRPVAALVYQRRQHVINLFVWPENAGLDSSPAAGSHSGYNFLRWHRDGMAFWAVSDLNAQELAEFSRLWLAE